MSRRGAPLLLPRQDGRRFVVTGGSSGLGEATAAALARGGARVVLAVRDVGRGRAAASRMTGSVEVAELDVSDLSSVRDFVESWPRSIDVLVNNAGVMGLAAARSVDGHELQMATNHLGHFALTLGLLDRITDRVVVLGSQAHRNARLDPSDLDMDRAGYDPYVAYANSKLANLLFMAELQRRLTVARSPLRVTGAHPGYTATKIMRSTGNRAFNVVATIGNATVGMSPARGARIVLSAAVLDVPGNTYLGPDGPMQLWGSPVPVGRSGAAGDPDLAKEVWAASEEATGVRWPL